MLRSAAQVFRKLEKVVFFAKIFEVSLLLAIFAVVKI